MDWILYQDKHIYGRICQNHLTYQYIENIYLCRHICRFDFENKGVDHHMARYTGPRQKLVRRLGLLPGLTSKESKKKNPPGQHGAAMVKKSGYRLALEEKQKIRFNYGLGERQLSRYVEIAKKTKGITGDTLLNLCEMRLDNIVFRLGFARSIPAARQIVRHGHLLVDGKRVNIPSFTCKPGQKITPTTKAASTELIRANLYGRENIGLPQHLNLDHGTMVGSIVSSCLNDDVLLKVNSKLIVEYYNT